MPALSIATVVPTFNQGDRAFDFLQDWAHVGTAHTTVRALAIVVDDGSREEESARQREAVAAATEILRRGGALHEVRYLRSDKNRGKGAAIRLGWSHAPADVEWLSFIDADGAYPAREYWRLAASLTAACADVVCASRIKMAGRAIERSLFRHVQGRVFATAVEELFHLGFYDTQAGMKFFNATLLRPLLSKLREDRWLLDIEILALLRKAGARCVEAPVDCHQQAGSSLVFGIDSFRMMSQLIRLRKRLRDQPAARHD